jgi:hypothetical protein
MSNEDKPVIHDLYVRGPSGREVHIQRVGADGPYLVPGYGESGFATQEEAAATAEKRSLPKR